MVFTNARHSAERRLPIGLDGAMEEGSVNVSQKKKPLALALLSMAAGIAMLAAGGWLVLEQLVYPKVQAADFRVDEHQGDYIELIAAESFEVGYQVEYSSDDPSGESNPANRTGRLLAIPTNDRLLVVLVPMSHAGSTYRGSVKELSSDIEMALTMNLMNQTFTDLDLRLQPLLDQRSVAEPNEGSSIALDGGSESEFRRSPSLKDLVLPVFVDANEDERGAIALVLAVGLVFLGGGIYLLIAPASVSTDQPAFGETVAENTTALNSSMTTIETARAKEDSASRALEGASQKSSIELQCPNGHSFSVPSIYRGTRRKCPTCGSIVES